MLNVNSRYYFNLFRTFKRLRKYQKQKVNNTLPSLYMRALYIKKRTSMEAHIPFQRTKRETSRVLKPTTRWRYREGDAKERRDVKREILA